MRMTGAWRTFPPDGPWRADGGRVVAVVRTERAVAVCFAAPVVELLDDRAVRRHPVLGALGPDLCLPDPDLDEIVRRSEGLDPGTEIGVALLDQRVAAGIGNVYKSEVAFACRVDPFTPLAGAGPRPAGAPVADRERALAAQPRPVTAEDDAARPGRLRPCGPPVSRVRHVDRGPASGRGRARHLVVSRLSIADAGRARWLGHGGDRRLRTGPATLRGVELHAAGEQWAIATPHTVATEAGAVAFERGGNAVDAALAAAVTLAVSYPHNCGVGGDLFALVQRPDGATIAVNASGRAPAAVDPDALRSRYGTSMPEQGPDSITVPGAVSGWAALHAEGATLPWPEAFGPAIALAFGGVAVSRSLSRALGEREPLLAVDPGMAEVFFQDGAPLPRGALFRQPALGATLQQLAADGPGALYGGAIGARYAAGLRAMGSPIALDDLAAHVADTGPPLSGRYRDVDVRVVPPNSQGFTLLEMLALVERLGIDPDPLGPDVDVLARVFAAAHGDRDHHLADPDAMRVHPSTLLDDGHLAGLADRIRDRSTSPTLPGDRHGTGDTIAMVTADAEGWAVSLIQSLWDSFGSGILEPETGIVAHDRGGCFTLESGHPNEIGPRKRPFHTLMPVLVHREGRLAAVAGSMGGAAQPQINAQNLIRALDLGMSAGDAVAAPRWTVWGQPGEGSVEVEGRVPDDISAQLQDAGFRVDHVEDVDEAVGHAHLILARPQGGFDVGSDPRADGGALAL